MLNLGNGQRLTSLERELADVRRVVGSAAAEVSGAGLQGVGEDWPAGDRPSLREEMAALADRVAKQDRLLADLAGRLSDALSRLDAVETRQLKQQGRLMRLATGQLRQARRGRADRRKVLLAEVALRRLANRVDIDAEQTAKSMTGLVERIGFRLERANTPHE